MRSGRLVCRRGRARGCRQRLRLRHRSCLCASAARKSAGVTRAGPQSSANVPAPDGGMAAPASRVRFRSVSAGTSHTCGVEQAGAVRCWGSDGSGQSAPPAGMFTQVAAGDSFTCGLRTDQSLVCWGDPSSDSLAVPAGRYQQVSVGADFVCAIRMDGSIACWGAAASGVVSRVIAPRSVHVLS